MTVKRDLLELRALFSADSAWCAGARGLSKQGYLVRPLSSDCVKRCVLGGMNYVARKDNDLAPRFQRMREAFDMSIYSLANINNEKGRLAVLNLIDEALSRV